MPLYPPPPFKSPSPKPLTLITRNKQLADTLKELGLKDNAIFGVLCKTYGYKYVAPLSDEKVFIVQGAKGIPESDLEIRKREYQRLVMAIKAIKTCMNNEELSHDTKELLSRDMRHLDRRARHPLLISARTTAFPRDSIN